MHRFPIFRLIAVAFLLAATPGRAEGTRGLGNATVFVIRHADKPEAGDGLSPAGEARARACVAYFKDFKLDAIFAAADSRNSRRPRLTVEPLAKALGLPIDTRYKDKECQRLADDLRAHRAGNAILICWHHGTMSGLLQAMGADPAALLPGGHWPEDEYRWVIVLRYDAEGNVKEARREVEPLERVAFGSTSGL